MVFVISASNGDTSIEQITKEELEQRLSGFYYGDKPQFLDRIPSDDPAYWPENAILVIVGVVTVPQPDQVVTRWTLPSD